MRRALAGRGAVLVAAALAATVAALGAAVLLAGRGGADIRGVVVDAAGAPVANATVTLRDAEARTDGSGEFELTGGEGWVTVRKQGWLPRTRAASPQERVVVRLARDAPGTVTFAFGGDVMFGRRFFDRDEDGRAGGLLPLDADVEQHLRLLDGVRPALADADIAAVNLETPLAEDPYPDPTKSRPSSFHPTKDFVFASRPAAARALARAGVDVVGIANNHLYDRLGPGVASTRSALEAAGYESGRSYFGAGAQEDQAWAPAVREVRGTRVGFLGCTSITGDDQRQTYVAGGAKGGAARCEPERLEREVRALALRVDVVVTMIHGGFEYGRDPSARIRALSDTAVAAGSTMVINHHPHVVGGLRFVAGRLTAWTLGNLLFDQTVWPTFESYLLRVVVRRGRVVSAWIEPLRIENFRPAGVFGEDADWVAQGTHARSQGPWVQDGGSLWLDAAGRAAARRLRAGPGVQRIREGCAPGAARDLLWTGDFEARDLREGSGAPLWNVSTDFKDRRAARAAAHTGRRGVRLRQTGADRQEVLLTPAHRILVEAGSELTVLLHHRAASGRPSAALVLSWYNDTRGGSQAQTVVDLPPSRGWRGERVDVRVPRHAVAVQPFVRLAPPELSLAELDIDDVRLIAWGEPGCGWVRRPVVVTGRAVPPLRAEPVLERVEARQRRIAAPAALPAGPAALEGE